MTVPTGSERRRSALVTVSAALVIGLALAGAATFVAHQLAGQADQSEPALNTGSAPFTGAPALVSDESYVETRALGDGTLVVRHFIRTREPLDRVRLALPVVPGAEDVSASRVEVMADGARIDGASAITDRGATYALDAATDLQVSYHLQGAVQRSDSVPGRALAVVTTLDVSYAPRIRRETRVLLAPAVLSLACTASPQQSLEPCGEADGTGQWQVELVGDRVRDRIVAALTLD